MILIVSDLRRREVSLLILIIFGLSLFVRSIKDNGFDSVFSNVLINSLLLILMWGGVYIYMRIRHGRPLGESIGAGDLIFIWIFTPMWDLMTFTKYLTVGFIVSLTYRLFSKQHTIPLVATLAIQFLILELWLWIMI